MATRTNDLTEFAKPVADYLHKRIGSLKTVFSAGVIALSKLSAEEREEMISEANGLGLESLDCPKEEFRKRVCEVLDDVGVLRAEKKHPQRARSSKS